MYGEVSHRPEEICRQGIKPCPTREIRHAGGVLRIRHQLRAKVGGMDFCLANDQDF